MKKIGKLALGLGTIGSIVTPIMATVSCGATNDNPDETIVYYYDSHGNNWEGIVPEIKAQFEKAQTKAIADGEMSKKVKLVMKPAQTAYWAAGQMTNTWGYNDIKSPDIWFGSKADLGLHQSKSGRTVLHGFTDSEYSDFWNYSKFDQGESKPAPYKPVQGIDKGKDVRYGIPWYTKSFLNFEYDDTAVDVKDKDLITNNEKYKNSVLGGTGENDLKMKDTIMDMSNDMIGGMFSGSILEYLRGPQGIEQGNDDPFDYKRNETNGHSNSFTDLAFIAEHEEGKKDHLGSIAFAGKKGTTGEVDYTDQKNLDTTKPSELNIAWHQIMLEKMGDKLGKTINGFGYRENIATRFRTSTAQDVDAAKTDLAILGFMGQNTTKNKSDLFATKADNHQFKNIIGTGIDWANFLEANEKDGNLQKNGKPSTKEIEDALKHYHVYRMPGKWQADNGDGEFNLEGADGKYTPTKTLDGHDIYGLNDGKATQIDIKPQEDGDYLNFNERTWEIRDPKVKANKIYALKLFTGALYDRDGDADFAKDLFNKTGTFSANKRLNMLGAPKVDEHGKFKTELDRLLHETSIALGTIDDSEKMVAKRSSDWADYGNAYWSGLWALDKNSDQSAYENAKHVSDTIKNKMEVALPKQYGIPTDEV